MKKILVLLCIGIFIGSGCSVSAFNNNDTEYWGVVIVALNESQQPYIYDALLQSSNWDSDHLKLLWKENATREAIFSSLEWLCDNADDGDIVLFSVDMHGTNSNGSYGIWPWDGYQRGMITVDELDVQFDNIKAKGFCLILDCCLAGNFVNPNGNLLYKSAMKKDRFQKSVSAGLEGNNRVVIMGTMPNGLGAHWIDYDTNGEIKSDISPSSTLSKALSNKYDENQDGSTSAEECFRYLKKDYRKYALMAFLDIPLQIYMYLIYRYIIKPFPTLYDSYDGELPLVQ
jgi:hypothetical protein